MRKLKILVYGTTFEKAKQFLITELLPQLGDEPYSIIDYEKFYAIETSDMVIQTNIQGQMPSRCNQLYYDKNEAEDILVNCIFPLANLPPYIGNRRIPY